MRKKMVLEGLEHLEAGMETRGRRKLSMEKIFGRKKWMRF